jgi:hypothetical protein
MAGISTRTIVWCLIPLVGLSVVLWMLGLDWVKYIDDKDFHPIAMTVVSTHGADVMRTGDGWNCTVGSDDDNGHYVSRLYVRPSDRKCQTDIITDGRMAFAIILSAIAFCVNAYTLQKGLAEAYLEWEHNQEQAASPQPPRVPVNEPQYVQVAMTEPQPPAVPTVVADARSSPPVVVD